MEPEKPIAFADRDEWRRWLESNHAKETEAWLLFYKKHVGVKSLQYADAVEEALCWGWIDGKLKSIDGRTHKIRFTPRRGDSVWSMANRKRAERMIREGRMTAHGMVSIDAAKRNGEWAAAYALSKPVKVPEDLLEALERNKRSMSNFNDLSNSHKFAYVYWIESAKREETRKKRIRETVRRTSRAKTLEDWFDAKGSTSQ